MKKTLRLIGVATVVSIMSQAVHAETDFTFTRGTSGTWNADWNGAAQRTDFFQWSIDLKTWHYAPVVEYGAGVKSHGLISTTPKFFVRLQHAYIPSTDPEGDDYDFDGLSNIDEVTEYNTDPMKLDTDQDGLSDFWEIAYNLDPRDDGSINPDNGANGDQDADGVTNLDEYWYGGDPFLADTDGDGLSDSDELYVYFTSINLADLDNDGLNDYAEVITHGTSPYNWDCDRDTLSDGDEVLIHSSNPLKMDTDGDWMWDDWEVNNGLNPANAADGLLDADSDGLANQLEYVFMDKGYDPFTADSAGFPWAGDPDYDGLTTTLEFNVHLTNPRQPDMDRDRMDDGWEIQYGFNAKVDNATDSNPNNNAQADPDGDNLTNEQESAHGTNPNDPDTDGDLVNDDVEINQGTNPKDPNDHVPPPNGTVPVSVTFGDHSGSHSEKYRITLTPVEGDTQVRQRTNRAYGQTQTDTFHLPKGAKYTVVLKWVSTDPEYRDEPNPDYDYTLEFTAPVNAHLAIEDLGTILGVHDEGDYFYADEKEAKLHVPLFEWITPKGSPVTAPDDLGDGKNEFFYDSAVVGEMLMNLKILVKPTGTAGMTDHNGIKFSDRCVFVLPTITGSSFAWAENPGGNPGGLSKTEGEHLKAKATYSTLPYLNSSFGLKQAKFNCDQDTTSIADADFEVFFTKNATNHSGGLAGTPNWFHYWKQFVSPGRIATLTYDNAIAPALGSTVSQTRATKVSQKASEINVTTNNNGIHTFYETLVHESYHITLWEGWWGAGGNPDVPAGSDRDGDNYPNSFETSTDGVAYNFDPDDINDLFDPNTNSSGFQYEEAKCMEQESLIPDVTIYDAQDWSFDLTTKGKNQ